MIVSMHVTHSSAGGTAALNDVVPSLEEEAGKRLPLMPSVSEYVIVRTCNRFEAYVATSDNASAKAFFDSMIRTIVPSSNISYILEDKDTIRHLFRVVCGLDSLIVGEDQIQHQVRESYIRAKEEGHVNGMLTRLFDKALAVGKRVRTETALNKGAVSVGSAAVELAEDRIGDLGGKSITILGAGDIASVIAKNLVGKNLGTVIVSNRTYSRAIELADELGGKAVSMARMTDAVADSDVVLVATGAPHPVLRMGHVTEAMERRPDRHLLIIDVSIPRNTEDDVAGIPNVELENMDSLQSIAMRNAERRRSEIASAEKIISEELAKIAAEQKEQYANDVIRRIGIMLADIRERELATARSRMESADESELLDDLSRAVVNKIAAELYKNLREASRDGRMETCAAAVELFGLEESE
ncbi:MAG: glutamyl-tRNA reductase [Thermoplasmata archaeon]|nr:glutamyl-tRNA reductase [Thermoplasmata archaeon]